MTLKTQGKPWFKQETHAVVNIWPSVNMEWNRILHMRLLNIHCVSVLVLVMLWVSEVFHSKGNPNSMTYLQHRFNSTWSEIKSKCIVWGTLFWECYSDTQRYSRAVSTPTHAQITSEIRCSHCMQAIPFYKLSNNIKHQIVSIYLIVILHVAFIIYQLSPITSKQQCNHVYYDYKSLALSEVQSQSVRQSNRSQEELN